MGQPEKAEQEGIKRLIGACGGKVYVLGTRRRRTDWQGTCQTPGLPDLVAFVRRLAGAWLVVFIEVKAKHGRLSDEQRVFQQHCHDAGIEHVVGGVDDVIAWLIHEGVARAEQFAHYRVQQKE